MKRWSVFALALVIVVVAGGLLLGPIWTSHALQQSTGFPKELMSYRDVVKKVLPAVVSLEAHVKPKAVAKTQRPQGRPQLPEGVPEEFRKFFEDYGRSPFGPFAIPEMPRQGFGSGFFVGADGAILTNLHVVDGAESVTVTLQDGRQFVSKDIKGDRRSDLAILRIDAKGTVPYLEFGDSAAMEIGDRVLAFGAPFGLTGSVTSGIVSAKGRSGLSMNFYEDFLQTDAAINPGNSGGPLISLDGRVIGINSAIKSRNGGFQGVGLAVSSNLAERVAAALLRDGVVRRGYLGVQVRELTPEVAQRFDLKDGGVVVAEVFDNTPAAKAELKPGDIITSIDGKAIRDGSELQSIVTGLPISKSAEIALVRDGQPMKMSVVIEELPSDFGAARVPAPRGRADAPDGIAVDKIGIEIADLTPEAADDFGLRKGTRGVVITRVEGGSRASLAGLRRGHVIAKIDGQAVNTAADARDLLEKANLARGVLLQVYSPQGGTNVILLKAEGA